MHVITSTNLFNFFHEIAKIVTQISSSFVVLRKFIFEFKDYLAPFLNNVFYQKG